jgi:hypothetical protein
MAYLVGGRGRTVGLVAALLCGLALAFAAPLISYLPKLLLGLMLLYAAIELATVLIRDQWARMPAADRVVLVVVLMSFLALGFLEGLVIGIVAGLAVFAFSYARVDLVREGGNAARYRSTVFRPAAQLQALDQDPDAIQVIALQGYLFFGSVHNLLQRVGVLLGAAAKAMWRKMPKRPSPSIRPASSSSTGSARKYCRMRNVPTTACAPKMGSMSNGRWVLSQPRSFISTKRGMMMTSSGINSAVRSRTNRIVAPGNRMRANAYPPSEATAIVPTVLTTPM